jgi:hypothetical protein
MNYPTIDRDDEERSNASLMTGLRRNATAPDCSARFSSSSVAWALKKTTEYAAWFSLGRCCNSKPSIFGIRTSSIRQAASTTRQEFSS